MATGSPGFTEMTTSTLETPAGSAAAPTELDTRSGRWVLACPVLTNEKDLFNFRWNYTEYGDGVTISKLDPSKSDKKPSIEELSKETNNFLEKQKNWLYIEFYENVSGDKTIPLDKVVMERIAEVTQILGYGYITDNHYIVGRKEIDNYLFALIYVKDDEYHNLTQDYDSKYDEVIKLDSDSSHDYKIRKIKSEHTLVSNGTVAGLIIQDAHNPSLTINLSSGMASINNQAEKEKGKKLIKQFSQLVSEDTRLEKGSCQYNKLSGELIELLKVNLRDHKLTLREFYGLCFFILKNSPSISLATTTAASAAIEPCDKARELMKSCTDSLLKNPEIKSQISKKLIDVECRILIPTGIAGSQEAFDNVLNMPIEKILDKALIDKFSTLLNSTEVEKTDGSRHKGPNKLSTTKPVDQYGNIYCYCPLNEVTLSSAAASVAYERGRMTSGGAAAAAVTERPGFFPFSRS